MTKKEKKYVDSQARAARPITNDDLVCKRCMYEGENLPTAHCNVYRVGKFYKPTSVLSGGSCPKFRNRNNG